MEQQPRKLSDRRQLRNLRHLKLAAQQVERQDAEEEAAARRLRVIRPHPARKAHKAIVAAVQAGDVAEAERLFSGAPAVYRAVFHGLRFACLLTRP